MPKPDAATDDTDAVMIPAWIDGSLRPAEKLSVHRLGLRHKAVSVFVMHGTRTLIQKRALSKYHTPGLWANACCTHPNWMEDPLDCAHRRLFQELGITGLNPIHRGQVEYRADVGGGLHEHELVDIYVAESDANLSFRKNPSEVADVKWIERSMLDQAIADQPEAFTPWLRIYLAEHAARIFDR